MVLAVEHFRLTVGSAEEATLEVRRDCCSFSVNLKKKKVFIEVVEFKKGLERLHRTASKSERFLKQLVTRC